MHRATAFLGMSEDASFVSLWWLAVTIIVIVISIVDVVVVVVAVIVDITVIVDVIVGLCFRVCIVFFPRLLFFVLPTAN